MENVTYEFIQEEEILRQSHGNTNEKKTNCTCGKKINN